MTSQPPYLGTLPQTMNLVLSAGSDFVASLVLEDESGQQTPYPAGVAVSLELDGGDGAPATWTASIDGAVASWNVDEDLVDAALQADLTRLRLWYVDGATRLLWAKGAVIAR